MMKYPATLIPVKGWKSRINLDEVDSFSVGRRIVGDWMKDKDRFFTTVDDKSYALAINDESQLPDLNALNLANLSMNILSEDSGIGNLAFWHKRLDKNEKSWNGSWIFPWKYRKCLQYEKQCYVVVFQSVNLHHKTFQYPRQYQKKVEWEKDKEKMHVFNGIEEIFNSGEIYRVTGEVYLRHEPTEMNYWHVVLVISAPQGGADLKRTKDGWRAEVGQIICKTILRKNILINPVEGVSLLKRKYYEASDISCLWLYKWIRDVSAIGLNANVLNNENCNERN
jgi:hypothetical protein